MELQRRAEEAKAAWDKLSGEVAWASHHYFANPEGPKRVKEELAKDLMMALLEWRKAKDRYEAAMDACDENQETVTVPNSRMLSGD